MSASVTGALKRAVKRWPFAIRCLTGIRASYMRYSQSRIGFQASHWSQQLEKESGETWDQLGLAWGQPTSANDPLGNYARVLELLTAQIHPRSTVLEIGSYGGKWTQYLLSARTVICVDLFDESGEALARRFGKNAPIRFYKTRGNELEGIESHSVDLVFSMDSLVRVPQSAIAAYLHEAHRVLAPGGSTVLHLPCADKSDSAGRNFTNVSLAWIDRQVRRAGFDDFTLDTNTLTHGVLVLALKAKG